MVNLNCNDLCKKIDFEIHSKAVLKSFLVTLCHICVQIQSHIQTGIPTKLLFRRQTSSHSQACSELRELFLRNKQTESKSCLESSR